MNTHHAIIAVKEIPSGSMSDRSPRVYSLKQRETSARKFSGVRSSGQYCRSENLRHVNDTIYGREMKGHISLTGMDD
jgi:hypothetical protein